MAFDQSTRNQLQKFVGDARKLLSEEFTQQLQNTYGLDPNTGTIAELSDLPNLSPDEQQTATLLRDTLEHYLATSHIANPLANKELIQATLDRIVREQAFTVLNRLAALRMAEAREFIIESISQGYQSKGFQLYQRIAGSALGETGQAYQVYLFSMFDELSLDLAVLFDRYSAQGRLFPRETVLQELLDLINQAELEQLWAEDETIGWIYQYWNIREEIDQAREASRAPRNSREMAVRNQFFTPRYIVEFLTDNTLGKTWYEMCQGKTRIVEKCQYLIVDTDIQFMQPGDVLNKEQVSSDTQYIPFRKAKDPRCLKIIDPACGSGHFLLYVFDVLISIYEEAWEKEPQDGWSIRGEFSTLHSTYDSFDEYQRAIPALIIANNLYGIDIDPRAIQIAGLAIWLRGQKYWNEIGLKQTDRPIVKQSHLVCAESLYFDESQLARYKRKLPVGQGSILSELLNIIIDKMALAGEMGILLKLEQDIKEAINLVEIEYQRYQESGIQDDLFGREHIDTQLNLNYSVQSLDNQFFNDAERLLTKALTDFVTESTTQSAYKNKLFAEDIAHSLAFIDLMKVRFDAIVMNPPFGKPSVDSESYMDSNYPDCPSDVYQAFVTRGQELLVPNGFLGAITSRTGFFLGTYQNWRNRVVLKKFRPLFFVDLGEHVLDAMVETAAFVLRSISNAEQQANLKQCLTELENIEVTRRGEFSIPKYQKSRSEKLSREQTLFELNKLQKDGYVRRLEGNTIKYQLLSGGIKQELNKSIPGLQYPKMLCIRLVGATNKQQILLHSISDNSSNTVLKTDPSSFDAIPGSPFSYWVSDKLRNTYKKYPVFKSKNRTACQGIASGDDFRYARMWWEVKNSNITPAKYHRLSNQGAYCVLYYKYQTFAKGGSMSPFYSDIKMVFNWSQHGKQVKTSEGGNGAPNQDYYYKSGFTWSLRALRYVPSVLPAGTIFSVRSMSAFSPKPDIHIMVGNSKIFDTLFKMKLGQTGRPEYQAGIANVLPVPETEINNQKEVLEQYFNKGYLNAVTPYYCDETSRLYNECWFERLEAKSLSEASNCYKDFAAKQKTSIEKLQQKVDKKALELYGLREEDLPSERLQNTWVTVTGLPIEAGSENSNLFLARDLISNLFGKLFGRFTKIKTERNHAFDPLPVPNIDHSLKQLSFVSEKLKALLKQGIAPVSHHFDLNIADTLSEFVSHQYQNCNGLHEELLIALNVSSFTQYFTKPTAFFDYHLSQYSGFSRIAPVYLPLSSLDGNFVLWIFYQKLSRATLFNALNDVIAPTVRSLEENYNSAKHGSTTEEAQAATLLEEIREFRDTIQTILADGFQCDIDDGVVLSAAPLYPLFKHLDWREELKQRWQGLSSGEYEWSKLAYYYWPERVLKKCHQDRSIAIAHNVEADLWEEVEVPVGRTKRTKIVWQAKELTDAELADYIQQKIAKDKSLS